MDGVGWGLYSIYLQMHIWMEFPLNMNTILVNRFKLLVHLWCVLPFLPTPTFHVDWCTSLVHVSGCYWTSFQTSPIKVCLILVKSSSLEKIVDRPSWKIRSVHLVQFSIIRKSIWTPTSLQISGLWGISRLHGKVNILVSKIDLYLLSNSFKLLYWYFLNEIIQ